MCIRDSLKEGDIVQIDIDTYKGTLMNIASEACSNCSFKGRECRYGIDGYKSKSQLTNSNLNV